MSQIVRNSFFTQDVMNYVVDNIYPRVVDAVTRSNIIFQILWTRKVPFIGKNKVINFKYKQLNNGQWFRGFDKLNTNTTDTTQQMYFEPKFFDQPVVFANTDIAVSTNKFAVIDYLITRFEEATQEMADKIGNAMYWIGTPDWKTMQGLKACVDDWSTVAIYGNKNRLAYIETNPYRLGSWSLIWGNVDSAGWSLTLARMEAMWNAVTSWKYQPDIIITTKALRLKLQSLLPTVNTYNVTPTNGNSMNILDRAKGNQLVAQLSFTDVYFKWVPVVVDEKCPEGELYMVNLDTFELGVLPTMPDATPITIKSAILEGQYDENFELKDTWFHRAPTLMPYDQYGTITHIYFGGEMWSKNPKYNGYFTGLSNA